MCDVIPLQATLSPQNYSHHMMRSLDMLYKEVQLCYLLKKEHLILQKYYNGLKYAQIKYVCIFFSRLPLKEQFTTKLKMHIFPLTCSAVCCSRLFWCERRCLSPLKYNGTNWLYLTTLKK